MSPKMTEEQKTALGELYNALVNAESCGLLTLVAQDLGQRGILPYGLVEQFCNEIDHFYEGN